MPLLDGRSLVDVAEPARADDDTRDAIVLPLRRRTIAADAGSGRHRAGPSQAWSGIREVQEGLSALQHAAIALREVHELVRFAVDLCQRAADGQADDNVDERLIDVVVQIDAIGASALYGGRPLLDGSLDQLTLDAGGAGLVCLDLPAIDAVALDLARRVAPGRPSICLLSASRTRLEDSQSRVNVANDLMAARRTRLDRCRRDLEDVIVVLELARAAGLPEPMPTPRAARSRASKVRRAIGADLESAVAAHGEVARRIVDEFPRRSLRLAE